MRVVHIAPTAFGAGGIYGGGERYPLELCRALARHVACELVTFGARAGRFVDSRSGLRVRRLRAMGFLAGHPAHPVAPEMVRFLRGADVVHTHHLRSLPSRLAAIAGRAARAAGPRPSLVVTDHGLQGSDWGGLLPRLFDRFLLVSEFSARELRARADRTRIILGGADPDRFRPDPDVARRGVLFLGRLTPHKGVDGLIEALPADVELRIAGSEGHDPEPPERDYPELLRRLAAGREVRFLGPVPDRDLPGLLRSAVAVVMPSVERTRYGRRIRVSELLGLTAIEAMASGTPVIASSIGGLPEVVADGESGFLVEPGNVHELRDRIERLTRDPVLARRLGVTAREVFLARLTWDACAQRTLRAYEELAAAPARDPVSAAAAAGTR